MSQTRSNEQVNLEDEVSKPDVNGQSEKLVGSEKKPGLFSQSADKQTQTSSEIKPSPGQRIPSLFH